MNKNKITNLYNITIKKFERILYVKNNNEMTYKSEYSRVSYNENEPTKLWLYYDKNDTHIGTYDRINKEAWYFPWIGKNKSCPELNKVKGLK